LYPYIVGAGGLAFMIPLLIIMLIKKEPVTAFHDEERGVYGDGIEFKTAEHYLFWLLGMLGISAIFGFVIGIAVFIYAFVHVKAKLTHFYSAVSALAFITFLGTLSHFLTLRYPEGVLQSFVELPWPLQ
jgi:hypothetical protein